MVLYSNPNNIHPFGTERYCLKYLYKQDNAYLMDNHLAAFWCWMKECDENGRYGFLHIDRHHDMCREGNTPQLTDINNISIDNYLSSKYTLNGAFGPVDYPTFSWNTYITKCYDLFPDWFSKTALIIEGEIGQSIKNQTPKFNFNTIPFNQALKTIEKCLSDCSIKWIVNVDMDYFFRGEHSDVIGSKVKRRFKESTIIKFSNAINRFSSNIQVLTIALSPECCGDMDKAIEAFHIFSKNIPMLQNILDK